MHDITPFYTIVPLKLTEMKAAKNRAKRQGRIQGGGAKGAEAPPPPPPPPPPPLQVNEMRNILFGQNINSRLRKMSMQRHHCMNLHIKISKMPQKAFMRISDIDFLLNGTKSGLFIVSYKH